MNVITIAYPLQENDFNDVRQQRITEKFSVDFVVLNYSVSVCLSVKILHNFTLGLMYSCSAYGLINDSIHKDLFLLFRH